MTKRKIGLLSKKRGNYKLQEKISSVEDQTNHEVQHHKKALLDAGFDVQIIKWGPDFISEILSSDLDIVFNVSSLVEAAILEEYQIPFIGSGTDAIILARNKVLAKKLWMQKKIPTSNFAVINNIKDCDIFINNSSITYPLFIKPIAGRGSAGISSHSKIIDENQLTKQVEILLKTIKQPIIVENFLSGREITVGVLGNGKNLRVLPPLEIQYNGKGFLTFDKKENDDDEFHCPANLTRDEKRSIKKFVKQAYLSIGLRDFARIDTKLTPDGLMLLEANSFAGLTCTPSEKPRSYIGFMAQAEGNSGKQLLKEIVDIGLERINHQEYRYAASA